MKKSKVYQFVQQMMINLMMIVESKSIQIDCCEHVFMVKKNMSKKLKKSEIRYDMIFVSSPSTSIYKCDVIIISLPHTHTHHTETLGLVLNFFFF